MRENSFEKQYNSSTDGIIGDLQKRLKQEEIRAEKNIRRASREKEKSGKDSLTGLVNRKKFEQMVDIRIKDLQSGADKRSARFFVFFIDFDRFKTINDTFGHAIGDETLKHAAKTIQETLRSDDITARFGGDEFSAMIRAGNYEEAKKIAERVRLKMEKTPLEIDGKEIPITFSIGVTPILGDTQEITLDNADRAMYLAKGQMPDNTEDPNGRNRVAFYDTESGNPKLYTPKQNTEY